MANAWDMLINDAENPHPIMPNNPELNSYAGIDNSNPMAPLQGALLANSSQGRQMTMDMAKEKMSGQIAMQLMQAKMQLERQYPTYSANPTPWGSVLMVNPYNPNDNQEVGGGDGTAKSAYLASQRAKMADDNADIALKTDPNYVKNQLAQEQAKLELTQAQTGEAKAMAALRPAQVQAQLALANNRDNKGNDLTEADVQKIRQDTYAANGYDPKKPYMAPDGVDAQSLEPKVQAAINAERQRRAAKAQSPQRVAPAGMAAPQAPAASSPDMSSLFSPLSDD